MYKIKPFLKKLIINRKFRAVLHTFWQAAGGVLAVQLFAAHSSADVKAIVVLAVATGLSAVKNSLVSIFFS